LSLVRLIWLVCGNWRRSSLNSKRIGRACRVNLPCWIVWARATLWRPFLLITGPSAHAEYWSLWLGQFWLETWVGCGSRTNESVLKFQSRSSFPTRFKFRICQFRISKGTKQQCDEGDREHGSLKPGHSYHICSLHVNVWFYRDTRQDICGG